MTSRTVINTPPFTLYIVSCIGTIPLCHFVSFLRQVSPKGTRRLILLILPVCVLSQQPVQHSIVNITTKATLPIFCWDSSFLNQSAFTSNFQDRLLVYLHSARFKVPKLLYQFFQSLSSDWRACIQTFKTIHEYYLLLRFVKYVCGDDEIVRTIVNVYSLIKIKVHLLTEAQFRLTFPH